MSDDDEQEGNDEIDVDLTDEAEEKGSGGSTSTEARGEFLGEYESVESYFAAVLGELMHPEIVWVLEHLDFGAIRARFEADGSRYSCEGGAVYRSGPTASRRI